MSGNITKQIGALDRMTTGQLADRYEELHGQPVRTRHRAYLIRKVAWRIQANAEGDLTERARQRAAELANDSDVRVMAPAAMASTGPGSGGGRSDARIPSPGAAIVREYKGQTIRVVVLDDDNGFEYDGDRFRTLSAVAKRITGSHINGFRFFRLGEQR